MKILSSLSILITALVFFMPAGVFAQAKPVNPASPRVEVYYFHPNERCPIDQSIEENLRKLMQSDYAGQIKDGTLKFRVVNTDDKANEKFASAFEINAQALYIIKNDKGKEVRTNLTDFAFANGLSNVQKFRAGVVEEIDKALK